jgi:UDP-glucose 4-epimerase
MNSSSEKLAGKKCVVTGGAGFIGSHLATKLLELGCHVTVLDNFSTGYESNLKPIRGRIELIDGDVSDSEVVASGLEGADVVFHHAAMASVPRSMREPDLCHHWCATSTVNILHAAVRHGVRRVVLASTSAAYGDSPFVAKRESDTPSPLSPYAAAKLASEMYCGAFFRGFGLETVCLRYFNVFGPRQDPQSEYSAVIPRFVAMILEGRQPVIYGDGMQSRDFVYVGDVVRANLLAATEPGVAGGVFNVARGTSVTLLELLQILRDLLGRDIEPIHQPPRDGDVRDSLADISQARRLLGYEPTVTIREGLQRSIEYYQGLVEATGSAAAKA